MTTRPFEPDPEDDYADQRLADAYALMCEDADLSSMTDEDRTLEDAWS